MKSQRTLLLVAGCLAVLSLLVAGCPGSENCNGWLCSGHGACVMQGGSPTCQCETGYIASGAECVAELARMGDACTQSDQCLDGWCLKFGSDETGYCSKRDCQGNDSCVNYAGDGEMCCVDVGGEFFICMKLAEGFACGTQDGMCGASCYGQADSACHPSTACLSTGPEDPGAVCSKECSTDSDCTECENANKPDTVFSCLPISGGQTYCLEDDTEYCDSSLDCMNEDVCFPYPTTDGLDIEGSCGKLGDLPTGAECNEDDDPNTLPQEDRCAGFYCLNDHCAEVCSLETDCPENMVCGILNFCMDDLCNTTAGIGMCTWWDGSGNACGGDIDCPAHEVCDFYLDYTEQVVKSCRGEVCDLAVDTTCSDIGGPCGDDVHTCYNGFCLTGGGDSYCGAACDDDTDCPDTGDPTLGYECMLIGLGDDHTTGACIEANYGTGAAGDPCPFGDVNASFPDCEKGSSCLGNDDAGSCTTDQDCIDGLGADMNPVCVAGTCGFSLCSPKCDADGNCPPGLLPELIGGGACYCFPEGPTGTSEYGDPCIFGDVNADSDLCASGLTCLGNDDSGACTTDADCTSVGEENNPDCVAGTCGFSFCAARCDAQGSCSAYPGAIAYDISGSCFCIPGGPSGNADQGDPCPWDAVNADADLCLAGLACLGNDSAGACTVDDDCGDPETNPDCVSGVCGFSFCSAPCGAGDTCDEGFVPADVGGDCYCVPGEPTPIGNQDVGDPCIFGDIHADTDNCMENLACLGIDGASSPIDCSTGGDALCQDETEGLGGGINAYCEPTGNICVASFCAAECAGDGTCTNGTPEDISGTCFCIP